MKKIKVFLILAIVFSGIHLFAQGQNDSTKIKKVIMDYIGGYYNADGDRIASALNDDLAKRAIFPAKSGGDTLIQLSKERLVMGTRRKPDDRIKNGEVKCDIEIFEIHDNIATAKSLTQYKPYPFVDYIHLGKIDGKWQIINVIWGFERKGS